MAGLYCKKPRSFVNVIYTSNNAPNLTPKNSAQRILHVCDSSLRSSNKLAALRAVQEAVTDAKAAAKARQAKASARDGITVTPFGAGRCTAPLLLEAGPWAQHMQNYHQGGPTS